MDTETKKIPRDLALVRYHFALDMYAITYQDQADTWVNMSDELSGRADDVMKAARMVIRSEAR